MSNKVSKSSSVEKALEILDCFNERESYLTLNEILTKTGYSKTATFRMIVSLEKYGYLKRDRQYKETRFSLGWVFLNKASLLMKQVNIRETAKDDLVQLRNATGLTVQLAIKDGNEAVIIEQYESLSHIQIYSTIGKKTPLYIPSCPRLLLAYLPEEEQNSILKNTKFEALTKYTLTTIDAIKQELIKIEKQGFAISRGELHKGIIEIASPIFASDGNVIAAISIVGVESDFNKEQLEDFTQKVKDTAKTISSKFQHT